MEPQSEGGTTDRAWFQVGFERAATPAMAVGLGPEHFGRVLAANDAMTALMAYTRAQLLAMVVTELSHPDERSLLERNLQQLAAGTRLQRIEVRRRWVRGDGTEIFVRLDVSPVRDEDGRVEFALVQAEDVDAVETGQREVRLSEQRYRRAFEEAPFPMAWIEVRGGGIGRFTRANAALCSLIGYTEAELLAMRADALTHPDMGPLDADGVAAAIREVLSTGVAQRVRQVRRADGTALWARLTFSVLRDEAGVVEHAVLHAEDITESKQSAAALVASEARLKRSFENAPVAMLLLDLAAPTRGQILEANPAAARLFGYPQEVLQTMHVRDLRHPEDRDEGIDAIARFVDGVDRSLRMEKHYVCADGRDISTEVSFSVVADSDGRPAYTIAQIVDITERLATEAQLQQALRLESVGQLAGGVAHDFNNLLAGIINYAELLAMSTRELTDTISPEERAQMLADIGEITGVAQRGAELTRQLLTFSRRERITLGVLDLNAIVTDMHSLLRRTIGEHIDLRVVMAPGLRAIKADKGQMEQVLMNLAVNARDAMRDGGRLLIETANIDVDDDYVATHPVAPGPYVRLTVADTGTGMPPEVAARAFEPFFTTKPRGTSSGLGLATVYGIATQAGGHVAIYSVEDAGTTIRVLLPATSDVVAAAPAVAPSGARRVPTGQTILLVEDEEMVRDSTARMLQRSGFHVVTAADHDGALAAVEALERAPDVMITDVVLPGQSGKDLAVAMRARWPQIRVLFVSGYSQDVIVHQGVLEPGARLVEKPFSGADLVRAVWDVLDGA